MKDLKNIDYKEFEKYKYWLGESIPIEMQQESVKYFLSCDEELVPHILSVGNVFNWNNALKVIEMIGYIKNFVLTNICRCGILYTVS